MQKSTEYASYIIVLTLEFRVLSSDETTIDLAVNTAEKVYQSGVWSKSDVRHRAQVMNAIAAALRADLNRLAEMEVAQTGRSVRYTPLL